MSRKAAKNTLSHPGGSFLGCLRQFLTPALFKQAHAAAGSPRRCRWGMQPLLLVLCTMTWCAGDSLPERFEVARAFYVALHAKRRRPGKTAAGFSKALQRLPARVLRLVASAVRLRLLRLGTLLHNGSWIVFGCDGSALACPRTAELERCLGPAPGKPGPLPPVPQLGLSALVHLRSGLLWSWRLGKGVINERRHLAALLPTLPAAALVVADCGYQGYELACVLDQAKVAFLIRVSSLTTFYTQEPAEQPWRDGLVWYWPSEAQNSKQKPLQVRLLRVSSPKRKNDVWLVSNVLDGRRLSVKQAGDFYRMRWGSEGFFRTYKRTLGKVKLVGRTVKEVHREAEGSLLAVQLLLAQAAQARLLYGRKKEAGSVRRLLLEVRREIREATAGKRRGRSGYQKRLAAAYQQRRRRQRGKVKRVWPTRAVHKPPKPPKIRELKAKQKALLHRLLQPHC
jgi:Transposase DDE domain